MSSELGSYVPSREDGDEHQDRVRSTESSATQPDRQEREEAGSSGEWNSCHGDPRQGAQPSQHDVGVQDGDRWFFDRLLYERLLEEGFSGPDYETFAGELVRYAIPVVTSMLVSGQMFRSCRKLGRGVGSAPCGWSADDRRELAFETIATALRAFRMVAMAGRGWNPDGGASIATYFINRCKLEFPNVYRAWLREWRSWEQIEITDELPDRRPLAASNDPQDVVADRITARQVLDQASSLTRSVVLLTGAGYSQEEIADRLGTTRRAVEGALYRHRRRRGPSW